MAGAKKFDDDACPSDGSHLPRILPMQDFGREGRAQMGQQVDRVQSDESVLLGKGQLRFCSTVMKELVAKAKRFAHSSASVLVTGESGTGKELFSRLVHEHSPRSKQNYVTVNCAAMPEMLIESEFFGHERGAFTGAFQQRIGHFQKAHEGTILLDEISEIPATIQAKLLRVIEEQEVQRIGSNLCERIDVRIVATSNRDLRKATKDGEFRLDLFHRLNVLEIRIPPLRERLEDMEPLVDHFISIFQTESGHAIHGITTQAMDKLCNYSWPGNIRELRNVIHRAAVVCTENMITVNNLPPLIESVDENESTPRTLAEVERKMILESLEKFDGNKTLAAEELGVTARTINNKLKLYRDQSRRAA